MQCKRSSRRISCIFAAALVAPLIPLPAGAQTNYPMKVVPPNYIEADTVLPLPFNGGDDGYWEVPLPFDFTFYNEKYPQGHLIYVSTNGYINFLEASSEPSPHCPIPMVAGPVAVPPNGAIYPFWHDLIVNGSASVGTKLQGTAPNRQFVIEWRNVSFFDSPLPPPDFEIVLHETGTIVLQYRNVGSDGVQRGNSATIGVENQAGQVASQFSCNTASLGSGQFAIQFGEGTPPPDDKLPIDVVVDIKPWQSPNRLNVARRKGSLPAAILGTAAFDVTKIDPKTVKLAGVAPVRWRVEHVGPYVPHDRNTRVHHRPGRPDRYLDMIFKFDRQAIIAALGPVNHGEVRVLELRGKLLDGTEIKGKDSVMIIKPGKKGEGSAPPHHSRKGESRRDNDHDDDDDRDDDD